MTQKKLHAGQKLGFGIGDLGGNMMFTVMGFWVLFYLTDIAGLSPMWAGVAWIVSRVWDAVTDPAMGYISDRTVTRFGRRRPYLLAGAIPTMLAFWLFFTSPATSNQTLLMLWAIGVLMLLTAANTVISVPYSALTPELTDDYHERSSLNGYRFGCAVVGSLLGAAAVLPLVNYFGGGSRGWSLMGLTLGAIIAIVTFITFFCTEETAIKHLPRGGLARNGLPQRGFLATYKMVFTNKPYVILLVSYALHLTAITFLQSILAFYAANVYPLAFVMQLPSLPLFGAFVAQGTSEAGLRETLTIFSMISLLITAMVFIPVSVLVSKKLGKRATYQICFIIIGTAGIAIAAIGHLLSPLWFLALLVYGGIGVGFSYVAPFAMIADTVEYDAVRTSERKEGAYYGVWTLCAKIGMAMSGFISGLILQWGGYVPNVAQSPQALLAIRLIIGPIPAVLFLCAFILMNLYPLDEAAYNKLMGKTNTA